MIMKTALGLVIFVVVAATAIVARWYAMKDSISMYTGRAKPFDFRHFSLSTLLTVAFAIALGLGLLVVFLRRG
jgi:hypothetical protein